MLNNKMRQYCSKTLYINRPIEKLKEAVIKNNDAVWFGCDVAKFSNWKKYGVMDLEVYDTELVFGTCICLSMSKADRLFYVSCIDHAMVLTAFHDDKDEKLQRGPRRHSLHEVGLLQTSAQLVSTQSLPT